MLGIFEMINENAFLFPINIMIAMDTDQNILAQALNSLGNSA